MRYRLEFARSAIKAQLKRLWRIRVGQHRVIYAIDDDARMVRIAKIGPRERVYD